MITCKSGLLGTVVRLGCDGTFYSGVRVKGCSAKEVCLLINRLNDENRATLFAVREGSPG